MHVGHWYASRVLAFTLLPVDTVNAFATWTSSVKVTTDIKGARQPGTIRYVGLEKHGDKDKRKAIVGIEMDAVLTKLDGTYHNQFYFKTEKGKGRFVDHEDAFFVDEAVEKSRTKKVAKVRRAIELDAVEDDVDKQSASKKRKGSLKLKSAKKGQQISLQSDIDSFCTVLGSKQKVVP
jgi:dynactin complex subunit